jgi:hypothetical protein
MRPASLRILQLYQLQLLAQMLVAMRQTGVGLLREGCLLAGGSVVTGVRLLLPLLLQVLIDAVVHAVNEDYEEMAGDFIKLGFLSAGAHDRGGGHDLTLGRVSYM